LYVLFVRSSPSFQAHLIDSKHFDVVSPADGGRAYHFMVADDAMSAQAWVDAIHAALARGKPPKAVMRPKSAMALFGSVESGDE
jgi:hypothetical protein